MGVSAPLVGRVTRDLQPGAADHIFIGNPEQRIGRGFQALLTTAPTALASDRPCVTDVTTLDHLKEGDIVVVHPSGVINTMWRVNSGHNFLLVTERCNSNCLMCSQPPKDRDDVPYLSALHRKVVPLIPKDTVEVGMTGGEPTLLGDGFFELLALIKNELPGTEVHCLTNGRSFAWEHMARRLGELELPRLMLGIPLYSDHYVQHDHVVQARHAFDQTMLGLYNLGRYGQRIEIRVVLHLQTIPRLKKLARFIYRNLPFVEHVTFMGLENQGYTPHNMGKLWIDPMDYMDELEEAVLFLGDRGMHVSVYNSQLCLMPKSLWPYSRRSISDWKNIYLEACASCAMRNACAGLFASCGQMHSRGIKAFDAEVLYP